MPTVGSVPMSEEAPDAESRKARFADASQRGDRAALRELRKSVFEETVAAVCQGGYRGDDGWVDLDPEGHFDALHGGTIFYESTDELTVPPSRRGLYQPHVEVREGDCLAIARELGEPADPPAVLNMASRRNPGGGVHRGAGAQEENIFRRSDLFRSLYQFADYGADYGVPPDPDGRRYPIPRESGGIYTPPALVFRGTEADGYPFLPSPERAAFLTVPAIPEPDTYERDGGVWLTDEMAEATRRKIRAILRIAAHHGHRDLCLSAFGCGAFRNPPHHVARLFRETLQERELAGVFGRIVFAVIDDHNAIRPESPEGNYAPFARELDGLNSP